MSSTVDSWQTHLKNNQLPSRGPIQLKKDPTKNWNDYYRATNGRAGVPSVRMSFVREPTWPYRVAAECSKRFHDSFQFHTAKLVDGTSVFKTQIF